jgi:GT2 family glycosyltransferase
LKFIKLAEYWYTALTKTLGLSPIVFVGTGTAYSEVMGLQGHTSVAVLVTSHNRVEATLRCFQALFESVPPNVKLSVWLVDDGSTDGTFVRVSDTYPEVHILRGDGNLYWARGMAMAEGAASTIEPDFYLWLNDDVVFNFDGLSKLINQANENPECVIVGALKEPKANVVSYGALRRIDWHPLRFRRVNSLNESNFDFSTFNGNCVLIPRQVHDSVGLIDPRFQHAYADIDYGLRVVQSGNKIQQTPTFVGQCARNLDTNFQGIVQEIKSSFSKKGRPIKSQSIILLKHGGPIGLLLLVFEPPFRIAKILTKQFRI